MDNKVVISHEELAETRISADTRADVDANLKRPIPIWAMALLWPSALLLPILCILAVILRLAFRNQPPRTSDAWARFLCTLLIVSGLINTIGVVAVLSYVPAPFLGSAGLAELDEQAVFPQLPASAVLDGEAMSQQLKPLVIVVSPMERGWFGREMASNSFGSGALIVADEEGYLFITAHHVVPGSNKPDGARVLVSSRSGDWGTAQVAGYHRNKDLALLWMPRYSGSSTFVQPVSLSRDGQSIFVIGHPEGLRFSLTAGMISRQGSDLLQISAPVSPGNSGGPIYDDHGNLMGIVTGTMDKRVNPNAENINFAVPSRALLDVSAWDLTEHGLAYLQKINNAHQR